jgi:aspartyl/glutamyl-tRNA(Asn/Gln) amidotransferase C subunit
MTQVTFTKDDIEKLASLSRLALTDAEKDGFAKDIGGILAYVGQIQEVAAGADIAAHRTDKANYPIEFARRNVMREDVADKGTGDELNPDARVLIDAAPRHTAEHVQVKKILGGSQ